MKKGYFGQHWVTVLLAIILIGMAISYKTTYMFVAAGIFVFLIILTYLKFDSEEYAADKWWNDLQKVEKLRVKSK